VIDEGSRTVLRTAAAVLLAFRAAAPAVAGEPPAGGWHLAVPATDQPPRIDGRLDPGEWSAAGVLDDLRQVEPGEGEPASEATSVLLMVDRDHLYIALQCLDSDRDGILASQVNRDAVLDPDDRVEIVLDTFLDRRNAYFFQIGPGGSKGDALVASNGAFFNKDWDGIWHGRAVIHDGGWSAELAIPAKTLALRRGLDTWGFNVKRHIKRKNEEVQWAYPDRRSGLFEIASSGTLTGLAVLAPGRGLDVVPYAVLSGRRDRRTEAESSDFEPGLDVRYRLNPGLTATFTVNTDFAQTEVDDRVVNLSRFPVFLPEKRDFFLEDSGIFSFGPFGPRRNEILPFFSRRIGLSAAGEAVPIVAGVKLSGRLGRFSLGLLDVVTDELAGVGTKNLLAGRVSANLGAESQAGVTFTAGDPATNGDNALAGIDFTWRTRRLFGDRNFRLDLFALATADEPADGGEQVGGHGFGFLAAYPNDRIEAELGFLEVSDGFSPDLGFVRRRGVRRLHGVLDFRPRPAAGPVRRYSLALRPVTYLSLADGEIESSELRTSVAALFHSGDQIEVGVVPTEERLREPFEIAGGIFVRPGRYRFDRWFVALELSDKRPLSARIEVVGGDFFDGRNTEIEIAAAWRPAQGLAFEALWQRNDVELTAAAFTTHLARLRATIDFGPQWSWTTLGQWDDVTDSLGINSRLRWIVEPGRDLYFVLDRFLEDDAGGDLRAAESALTMKALYTFRF
jgi:hypothetical protein